MTRTKHDRYEAYWRAYFGRYDELRAQAGKPDRFPARAITSYRCTDGILFYFEEGTLSFRHRASGLSVQAMFNRLTHPAQVDFGDPFPDENDVGPLRFGEVVKSQLGSGELSMPEILIHRIVWMKDGPAHLSPEVARRKAEIHCAGDDTRDGFIIDNRGEMSKPQ